MDQERSTARTEARAFSPRPARSDVAVIHAATEALLPGIEEWASGEDVSDAREVLRDALRRDTDGYEMARAFDRAGWSVDFQLAGILNEADSEISRAHRLAVREWIAVSGARPKLSLGTPVVLPPGMNAGAEGEITCIEDAAGSYTVFVPSLGHVRDGLGTHGRIFTWEALEAANVAACELAVDPSWSTPEEVAPGGVS